MGVRRWVNRHSSVVTVLSIVAMLVAFGWIVQESLSYWRRASPVPDVWYYDLNTGRLFRGPGNALPPIDAPSGPLPNGENAGVRAKVFACGDCEDPTNRFIGWIEKLTAEAKHSMTYGQLGAWEGYSSSGAPYMKNLLVRAVDGDYWYSATTQAGRELFQAPRKKCPAGVVVYPCFPESR